MGGAIEVEDAPEGATLHTMGGDITIDGVDITRLPMHLRARRGIGGAGVFGQLIRSMLGCPPDATEGQVRGRLATREGLDETPLGSVISWSQEAAVKAPWLYFAVRPRAMPKPSGGRDRCLPTKHLVSSKARAYAVRARGISHVTQASHDSSASVCSCRRTHQTIGCHQ